MSFTRTCIIALIGLFWFFSGSVLYAQNNLETLPVFHDGRVMPFHTFARKVVREICGTERPYLIQDSAVIAEFTQIIEAFQQQDAFAQDQEEISADYMFLNPNAALDGGFGSAYSPFSLAGDVPQIKTALPIKGLNRKQITRIAERVKQLVPMEGRYFQPDELLILWISEPEVWAYIPILLVPETDYLDEIFDVSFENDVRTSQYRVSLYQLEKSQRYVQRLVDVQKRRELGQAAKNPVPFDQITERLESKSQTFRELTFHPQRQRPARMISLLYQVAGLNDESSSYISAFEAWGYLLAVGDIPSRQATEHSTDPSDRTVFHPTTQRWHDIADKLRFLMQIYDRTDSAGNPLFPRATMVEQQYEILIGLIDANLAEAAALMESVYPDVSYHLEENVHVVNTARLLPRLQEAENQQRQKTIRRVAISYYYSVKKLRNEIEAAYLALYDNGRSLRFLPLRSPLVLEMGCSQDNFGVQPWASATMILGSGETFVKRFFDSKLDMFASEPLLPQATRSTTEGIFDLDETVPADEDALPETPAGESNIEEPTDLADPSFMDQLFLPFELQGGILRMGRGNENPIGRIRTRFRDMLQSFTVLAGGKYGNTDFIHQARQFHQSVRQAAMQIEPQRQSFVDKNNQPMVAFIDKTAYPDANAAKLRKEYRYVRFHPFFWMGVFASLAVLLNGIAYVTSTARGKSVVAKTVSIVSAAQGGKQEETELPDYTNTVEEWFFISSVMMLMLAILIAFVGGVMRAGITGWAPVTNMYETIVMMALAAAIIGTWYALYPLLHPALQQAWIYTKFPGLGTLQEWLSAVKKQKTATAANETSGEAAMREAAMDFGVAGGRGLGGHHVSAPPQNPEDWMAQQHIMVTQRKMAGQCVLALPRLVLTVVTFYVMVSLANGNDFANITFFAAAGNMFAMNDVIDFLTVVICVLLTIWIVPHAAFALCMVPVILFRPAWIATELGIRSFETKMVVETADQSVEKHLSIMRPRSEMSSVFHGEAHEVAVPPDTSGAAWLKQARNAVLERKLFIGITAAIVFSVALIAAWNRAEFNPDIRPIAAVLRSNFWLTVHVIAIIVSYAAAFVAWGLAVVTLGYVVFGRYQRIEAEFEGERRRVLLPEPCQLFSPVIELLIKTALLLLIVGTVLGARWADYSWGRFWSWDPKEVWALITILFFVIVFHGKVARYYGAIGIAVGALFASIAVIVTWYGINFLPTFRGSVHAYGGGTADNAALVVWVFITANLLWGTLALLRYNAEVYGSETEE